MSPREGIIVKSRRYLAEARLIVAYVDDERVEAVARGDGEVYKFGWDQARSWWCTCPARRRGCHLLALGSIVVGRSR